MVQNAWYSNGPLSHMTQLFECQTPIQSNIQMNTVLRCSVFRWLLFSVSNLIFRSRCIQKKICLLNCSSGEETEEKRVVEGSSSSEDHSTEKKLPRFPQKIFIESDIPSSDAPDYRQVSSTTKSQAHKDMLLISGDVSSEIKFKVLTRLVNDVTINKSLVTAISIDKALHKIDMFDVFTTLARRIVRHPNDYIHQVRLFSSQNFSI